MKRLPLLRPLDLITFAFLGVMTTLVLTFHHNVPDWKWQASFYVLVGAWLALLIAASGSRTRRAVAFLRFWYPLLLCVLFFENVGNLIHMVLPDWQDRIPLAIDLATFGVHPTVWLQRLSRPWLNDLLQAAYTSYFVLSPLLVGTLLWVGKRREAEEALFGTTLTYYACYTFFVLFPIEGPHHTLFASHTVDLTGGWATALIEWIESFARVHGGALPSAHVAGSTVVLLYAYRYARRLFWLMLPAVLGLYAATVYGRYHYFTDVWTGWLTAGVGFAVSRRLFSRLDAILTGVMGRRKWTLRSGESAPACPAQQ